MVRINCLRPILHKFSKILPLLITTHARTPNRQLLNVKSTLTYDTEALCRHNKRADIHDIPILIYVTVPTHYMQNSAQHSAEMARGYRGRLSSHVTKPTNRSAPRSEIAAVVTADWLKSSNIVTSTMPRPLHLAWRQVEGDQLFGNGTVMQSA